MEALAQVSSGMRFMVGLFTVLIGVGTIVVCIVEVRHWHTGTSMIDKSQLGLRLAGAALLLLILAMIFFGVFYAEMIQAPRVFVSFWIVCMSLAAALFILATIDLRKLGKQQQSRERELYKEFAKVIREEVAKRQGNQGPAPAGPENPEKGETPVTPPGKSAGTEVNT